MPHDKTIRGESISDPSLHGKAVMDEKKVLASFISRLPEAILICDAKGQVLLNDSQSETYLLPEGKKPAGPASLAGMQVATLIDKGLIEHALGDISEQLKHKPANTVSSFVWEKAHRILETQVVPVLSAPGLFSGFVVILNDITQQNRAEKRVDTLLKTLSKNARSPITSIRAAIEAMRDFPGMDEDSQSRFKDIIYSESLVLSDILNTISEEYSSLIQTRKALKPIHIRDFFDVVCRRANGESGLDCRIAPGADVESLKIKADLYPFTNAVLFVLKQLHPEAGSAGFILSAIAKDRIVRMDIAWDGPALDTGKIKTWESMDIDIPDAPGPVRLKDILHRHHSTLWAYSREENQGNLPCLRFFIPQDDSPDLERFDTGAALPESRSHISDMALFDHEGPRPELDNRLLTELSYTSLIREIHQAVRVEELIGKHSQLPRLIHSMITGGTKIRTVTWLVTAVSDAILDRLLTFAIKELGPSPLPFAFITLGSEGRKEQTLKTDQDNAIVFKDPEKPADDVQAYFLALGEKVCTWLDQAGFDFCQGGIMAKNEKWCQPLSRWKKYFSSWIHAARPEDLLHTSIFFDFRFAFGDRRITDELSDYLDRQLSGWPGFFRNMAQNAVYFKPPIGFFGNFIVRAKPPHKKCLDIKLALLPVIDFARIYALKHGIRETGTQDRLYRLYVEKVLSREAFNELEQAYSFAMQIRFMGQIEAILGQNMTPTNYINPKNLSSIEKKMLKEVLKKIRSLQSRMSVELIGATDQQMG